MVTFRNNNNVRRNNFRRNDRNFKNTVIRKVIKKSSELLKKNGKFILEIGFDQKSKVIKLLNNKGFYINSTIKDLAKNDRCIVSTKI